MNYKTRILLASPHRYLDLARLWYRFVRRELLPAFARLGLNLEVKIFCDANASEFEPALFPGVQFSKPEPGLRDFMDFYDVALHENCDYLFFADADVFFLNGEWVSSYFQAFDDSGVSAISFVPRKSMPAIFALLCRTETYRELPCPVFACRYEFPSAWPNGVNLQPGDFAARQLKRIGNRIINVPANESRDNIAMLRSTTGIRAMRECVSQASGEEAFTELVRRDPASLAAAYDNLLLAALYEKIFAKPFAVDASGTPLRGSFTAAEFCCALNGIRDAGQLKTLHQRFLRSEQAISQMAAREGMELPVMFEPASIDNRPGNRC